MTYVLTRQYEMGALVGNGPSGAVWRATDRTTGEGVAVKLLDPQLSADPEIIERFVRERPILTAFLHPAYVRVRDVIVDDGVIALVMELVTGWDLRRHVEYYGPVRPAAATDLAMTVADALAAAHKAGVVHCDVKPSNILLENPGGHARLTDSRVARLARGYAGPAAWYANPEYATPEVIRGGPSVPATDVYALGLVLFEMLTGRPPYQGVDADEVLAGHLRAEPAIPANVPPSLGFLIADCLRGEPSARPTAEQVARRLVDAKAPATRDSRPLTAPPPVLAASDYWPEPQAVRNTGEFRVVPPVSEPPPRPAFVPRGSGRNRRGSGRRVALIAAAAVVIIAVGALVANGLSSTGGGDVGASTSQAPVGVSGTATSRPPAPAPPASATPATIDGAVAFANHWFEALSYAIGTGDTTALDQATSPSCQACRSAKALIEAGYRDGATLRGGSYTVRTVSADDFWSLDKPALRAVFDRGPRSAVGADGQLRETFPGGTFLTCQLLLERVDNRWRVREVLSSTPIA